MATDTAVLLIDPYNDFLHPKGKLNGAVAESLAATATIEHLKELVAAARQHKIPIFYGLHQQMDAHSFLDWQFMNRSLNAIKNSTAFEKGSWGAEFYEGLEPDMENGDVVVSKHWNSSSFQNTDLDYQLRQRGISKLIIAGMVTNTCVESTARYANELSDGTAGFSTAQKDAATQMIWPLFASKVTTVREWAQSLQKTKL